MSLKKGSRPLLVRRGETEHWEPSSKVMQTPSFPLASACLTELLALVSIIDAQQVGLLAPVLLLAARGKEVGEVQSGQRSLPQVDTHMIRHQPLRLLNDIRGPRKPRMFNSTYLLGLLSVPGGTGLDVPIVATPRYAVLSFVTIPIVVLR